MTQLSHVLQLPPPVRKTVRTGEGAGGDMSERPGKLSPLPQGLGEGLMVTCVPHQEPQNASDARPGAEPPTVLHSGGVGCTATRADSECGSWRMTSLFVNV